MTLDRVASLVVQSLQSYQAAQLAGSAGLSYITKNLAVSVWPEVKGYIWQRYGPIVMSNYVYPLARRTVKPVAQKMGTKIYRKYGAPLVRKTGNKVWRKVGQPTMNRLFPNFFPEDSSSLALEALTSGAAAESIQNPSSKIPETSRTVAPETLPQLAAPAKSTSLAASPAVITDQEQANSANPQYAPAPWGYPQTRLGRHLGMGFLSKRLK